MCEDYVKSIGVRYELQERDSFFDYPHVFTFQEEELMAVIRDDGRGHQIDRTQCLKDYLILLLLSAAY